MLAFNLQRAKALFLREFHFGFKSALRNIGIITFGIFLANLVIAYLTDDRNDGNFDISPTLVKYGLILMIGGFLYTSYAFKEFSKVPSRAEFLALPGSSLEKVLIKWLYTNPIFILVFTLFFWFLASFFVPYIAERQGYIYENEMWVSQVFWNLVGIYFIVHSIFFFGSIAFNKVPIVLTIVSVIIIALVLAFLNALVFRIFWADMFDGLFTLAPQNGSLQFTGGKYDDPSDMWQVKFFQFAFKYLLAPVLWIASIFKLSEKQV